MLCKNDWICDSAYVTVCLPHLCPVGFFCGQQAQGVALAALQSCLHFDVHLCLVVDGSVFVQPPDGAGAYDADAADSAFDVL